MKKLFKSLLVVVGLLFICLLHSCKQEDPKPNEQNYELYVTDRDQFPAWSPDGQWIAYYHFSGEIPEPANYPSGLYIIDKEGNNRQLVLQGNHQQPSWSPDGKWLVYSSGGLIQKSRIDGSERVTFEGINGQSSAFDDALFFPDWTSDGKQILFDRAVNRKGESNLFSMNADFSDSRPVYGNIIIAGRDPELIKEGDHFVYMKASGDWLGWEIFMSDTIRSFDARLTENNFDDLGPTWSPSGQQIAWSSNVQIKIMMTDGTNQKALAFGSYPSWSVNDKIVYSGANAAITKEVLYTIDPDGSNNTQITF